jgi:hypothetical protein
MNSLAVLSIDGRADGWIGRPAADRLPALGLRAPDDVQQREISGFRVELVKAGFESGDPPARRGG